MICHVVPIADHREHYCYIPCWCSPLEMEPNLLVHHAIDLREVRERQGSKDLNKKWAVIEVDELYCAPKPTRERDAR